MKFIYTESVRWPNQPNIYLIAYEQIKAKERYQVRQIKHVDQMVKPIKNTNDQIGPNQIQSMRDVLKQDGEEISSMVKTLSTMKKDLAI